MVEMLTQLLNDLLKCQLKMGCLRRNRGFTLIELLVALIIAVLVVSGLLSFVVSISNIERRELVKANAQQDLQDAADYIVRDLQEAVFIYDNTGLATIAPRIPPTSPYGVAGCNSTVTTTICQPVLAFWKRRQLDRCDSLPSETAGTNVRVGVVTGYGIANTPAGNRPTAAQINTACSNNVQGDERGDDAFVYTFVAYYLIRDTVQTATWSRSARIGRFEVRGGIPNPTVAAPTSGNPDTRYTTAPAIPPQAGYQDFVLPTITPASTIADVITQMNLWRSTGATAFTGNQVEILTDFLDDTPTTSTQHANVLTPRLPISLDNSSGQANADCQNISKGAMGANSVRVPSDLTVNTSIQLSSFYACINDDRTSARIYLRGTALARLTPNLPLARRSVTAVNLAFFPTAEARVLGRGLFVPNR